MLVELGFMLIGLFILWASAEVLIKSLQVIARSIGISDTFLGLTILSIGTSLPEIGTHIYAALDRLQGVDVTEIAVGTNIGSNLFQITIILGVVAFFMNVHAKKKFLKQDYMFMLSSILAVMFFGLDGAITRGEGVILVVAYMLYLYHLGKKEHFVRKAEKKAKKEKKLWLHWLLVPIGLAVLMYSAKIVLDNASLLANAWGVSNSLIGALLLGIGTALPEFVTALIAIKNKSTGMSIGVLVGSNITNPLFALGLGSIIAPHTVGWQALKVDLPIWFFASLIALFFLWHKGKIRRKEAFTLIALYIGYYYARIVFIG